MTPPASYQTPPRTELPPSETQPTIVTYRGVRGVRLHYRHWQPAGQRPVCRVVALHGIQSHSGWYNYSSRRWCEAGCELSFLDRRGSGMNEADRGHAADAQTLIDDVCLFLEGVKSQAPVGNGVPVVLLGVSWGGKLAVHVAAQRPDLIDGLVLLYPGLRARVRATRWQNLQLSLAERLRLGQKRVPVPLDDPALFTGDPHWQKYVRRDPLALHEVSVSFLLANRQLDRGLAACAPFVRCPALLLLAGQDRIIDNPATGALVGSFASRERRILVYPEACHTLEFEPRRDQFIHDVQRWVEELRTVRGTGFNRNGMSEGR